MEQEVDKNEIQQLGLRAIKEYFKIDPREIDPKTISTVHNKAKIAMQFEKEMNLNKRMVEINYIRVFRMVAEDKKELKAMIKKSLPQYLR